MKAQTVGDTSSLEFMRSRRVFEINPDHPIIKNLNVWLVDCFLVLCTNQLKVISDPFSTSQCFLFRLPARIALMTKMHCGQLIFCLMQH